MRRWWFVSLACVLVLPGCSQNLEKQVMTQVRGIISLMGGKAPRPSPSSSPSPGASGAPGEFESSNAVRAKANSETLSEMYQVV